MILIFLKSSGLKVYYSFQASWKMRVLIIVALWANVQTGAALKCWSCKKALTNDECNIKGSIQTCKQNEACVNTVITGKDGTGNSLLKGCSRKNAVRACLVQDLKNQGTSRTLCRNSEKNSRCTCCCENNLCNGPQIECKDIITCRKPDNPGNGRLRCERPITYGSTCDILCNKGYTLNGPRKITCTNGTDQGYWSPLESVACLAIQMQQTAKKPNRCSKKLSTPEHGSIACENSAANSEEDSYDYVGTICAFKCDSGYFRTGPETVQCLPGGRWSVTAPKCKKGMCQRPPQSKNRIDSCSDDSYFGSVCSIRCKLGFKLIGSSSVTCRAISDRIRQGTWSTEFPQCVLAVCRPQLMRPPNGNMTCSNHNRLGSACTFSCREGFELTELSLTLNGRVECVKNGEAIEWNGSPPKCIRLVCPAPNVPQNGNVVCTGDRRIGSKCTFSCNPGFDLIGTNDEAIESECIRQLVDGEYVGRMTVETITCAEVRCLPQRTPPENGQVHCSRENVLGSVCTFSCDLEFDMDGTTDKMLTNICEYDASGDGRGKWSAVPPTCGSRFYCPVTQIDPINGKVQCSDGSFAGSTCTFACDDGHDMRGSGKITCTDLKNDGDAELEWSSPAPVCVPSTCGEMWYDKTRMKRLCNKEKDGDGYPIGTICTYECTSFDHYMQLDKEDNENGIVTCSAKNKWSASSAPRCVIKRCPRLKKIENGGQPQCTRGNRVSSRCRFRCDSKFILSHSSPIICESGSRDNEQGSWDMEPPTCVLNECIGIPTSPNKGRVECSSGAKLGSYCTLKCERGYAPRIQRVDCQLSSRIIDGIPVKEPLFQQQENFCCAECKSEFRVALAIDARSNGGLQKVKDFMKIFLIQLVGRSNEITFSHFLYNADVIVSSTMDWVDITTNDNLQFIFNHFDDWNVEEEGKASDTASAVEYASNTIFSSLNSNAANFLIFVADDSPDRLSRATLNKISRKGINVLVGTGSQFTKIKWEKLFGDGKNVHNLDSNEIMNRMYELAFQNGCSNISTECV